MPPRFDPDSLTLDLSVADLLDRRLARSLGFSNRGGYQRMWLGQAIHSRYQEQALADDPSYRREVWVAHAFDHRGWRVTVSGRIDGVRREPDGSLVVEEIKSVRRGGELGSALREVYHQQARLYAWMLAAAHPADDADDAGETGEAGTAAAVDVRAELVLIEIGGDAQEREEVAFDPRGVEAAVKRRLNGLIAAYVEERMAADRRREAAARLEFPYPERRPGQAEIAAAVETALVQREHLLLEAPTGIGKTVSTLFPALAYCLAHDKRLFVLTAKTLQQEMATQVLELLNQEGAFRALRLRAKAKMCANGQVLCHEEYCPFAKDYAAKLQSSGVVGELLERHDYLDPDAIFTAAAGAEVCPFEVSLELSGQVQITVCDYNYAFEPYVSLSEFARDNDLSDVVLVVDEIHNLVDRGRGYWSPELSSRTAREAAEVMARGGAPVHLRIAHLCRRLARLIEDTVAAFVGDEPPAGAGRTGFGDQAALAEPPEEELWRLRPKLDAAFVDYLEHQRQTKTFRPDDEFVDLYFRVLRFLNVLVVRDDAFSTLVERSGRLAAGGDARLKVLCKDPSRFLGEVINRTHSTIGLSATLSPPEFYRDLLGFDPQRTAAVSVPNPFPAENRRVVIDRDIVTTYREREAYYPLIARRLSEFADSVPGNTLALFPSYAFLAAVAGHLEPGGKRVLVQRRASGDREREEILETLRSALLGDVLLLAVAGGVFAEGVDYPGDMLRAVAVVGPCLPTVSLEQKLLSEYYQERFDKGFEYAFVVPGMTRVVQAAGRLIRSADDTGVIALLDRRFLQRPYKKHLPPEWLDGNGADALCADPATAAAEFFV